MESREAEIIKITSERLYLRPMTDAEWNEIVDSVYANDECVLHFGLEKSDELRLIVAEPARNEVLYYSILNSDSEELMGYVGLVTRTNNVEFYVFKDYRHKGYAYEAVKAFMDSCMSGSVTGSCCQEFVAETVASNEHCVALLEKLGFERCGCGFDMNTGLGVLTYKYAAR